ncbi:MAG TPA: phosphatidylglycerophosphatase A [Ignavibacteria bacterium]|jgi:phosphatidylglycerophosphatase A
MALRIIKEKQPINQDVKVPFWANIVGSGLFTGYVPIASGTAGSFLALIIYLLPHMSEFIYLSFLILFFFPVGLYASERMRLRYGEDPYEVTIDEIVGQWFTYLIGSIVFEIFFKFKSFDPDFQLATKITFGFVGFLLFRFFDILKIEPAKFFDNKDSGFGIMMDDIISAFYAGILSSVITHFVWYKFLAKFLI